MALVCTFFPPCEEPPQHQVLPYAVSSSCYKLDYCWTEYKSPNSLLIVSQKILTSNRSLQIVWNYVSQHIELSNFENASTLVRLCTFQVTRIGQTFLRRYQCKLYIAELHTKISKSSVLLDFHFQQRCPKHTKLVEQRIYLSVCSKMCYPFMLINTM